MAQNITFDPNIKGKIWDLHNVPLRLRYVVQLPPSKFHLENYIIQEYINYRYCLFIIIKILKVLGFFHSVLRVEIYITAQDKITPLGI